MLDEASARGGERYGVARRPLGRNRKAADVERELLDVERIAARADLLELALERSPLDECVRRQCDGRMRSQVRLAGLGLGEGEQKLAARPCVGVADHSQRELADADGVLTR